MEMEQYYFGRLTVMRSERFKQRRQMSVLAGACILQTCIYHSLNPHAG